MNKVLHKQLAYNILANGTHMAQDLNTASRDAQQQTGTCLLTFHPTSRTSKVKTG